MIVDDPHVGDARTQSREVLLVANRRASGTNAELVRAAEQALRDAGACVEARSTESSEELDAVLGGADGRRVVLLGGDGSVQLASNSSARPDELALMPAGRANNIARSLGIPRDLGAAARLAVTGSARPFDLLAASAGDTSYLACEGISAGFLAQARTRYSAPNSAAVGAGLRAGVAALRKFRPARVVLTLDGRRVELEVAQVFVANTPLYAFGLRVAPRADVRDGRLDVVALSPRGRAGLLALAPRVFRGTHLGARTVRSWQAEQIRIDTGGWSPVVADSTDLGRGAVDVTVRPGALRVVAP